MVQRLCQVVFGLGFGCVKGTGCERGVDGEKVG